MQVADHDNDKNYVKVEDLLFMQVRRQGTKVFIKLELRKMHIFILQYSFIQLLLIYQKTIRMYSSTDPLHRICVSEKAIYTLIINVEKLCSQLT